MAGYGVDGQRMAVNGRGTDDRGDGENLSCRKNGSGVKVKVKNTWFATTVQNKLKRLILAWISHLIAFKRMEITLKSFYKQR